MKVIFLQLNIFFAVAAAVFVIFMSSAHAAPIEILDERAAPYYWLRRTADGNKILLDDAAIKKFNRFILERDNYSADLKNYPRKISAADLTARINQLTNDVHADAAPELMAKRNLDALTGDVEIRFAVTVERANVRILPTPHDGDRYDGLQATALDPAEAVAVLWESSDGAYVFAQARNYFGWIAKDSLAFTDRKTWLNYVHPKNFLVVTDNKFSLELNGRQVLFQMGAKIPLARTELKDNFWTTRIPVSVNGALHEILVELPSDESLNCGFLDCTANNFIRQSFKFLGDVYGWGGLDNSVDCSAYVGDVYRSMGLEIPRDANRQEGAMPIFAVFNNVTREERLDIVRRSPVGALLFKRGHVMLRLGNDDSGTPIIIHAASSYISGGQKIYVRKILVSDLNYVGNVNPTIDDLTGIAFARDFTK